MASTMIEQAVWHTTPIMGGLHMHSAEWHTRERPAKGLSPVSTLISATVAPDFDWQRNGVLWGVKFHRYVPRRPLEKRERLNRRTGLMESYPPPPIIPEHTVSGRVFIHEGLNEALIEAMRKCEEIVASGRPTSD